MKLIKKLYLYEEYCFLKSIINDEEKHLDFSEYIQNDTRYTFEEKARWFVKFENREKYSDQFFDDFWKEHKKKVALMNLDEISGYYTKENLRIIERIEELKHLDF